MTGFHILPAGPARDRCHRFAPRKGVLLPVVPPVLLLLVLSLLLPAAMGLRQARAAGMSRVQIEMRIDRNRERIDVNNRVIAEYTTYLRTSVIPYLKRINRLKRRIRELSAYLDRHYNLYQEKRKRELEQELEEERNLRGRFITTPTGQLLASYEEVRRDYRRTADYIRELRRENRNLRAENRRLAAMLGRKPGGGGIPPSRRRDCGAPLAKATKQRLWDAVWKLQQKWTRYQCRGRGSGCGILANEAYKHLKWIILSGNAAKWQRTANLPVINDLIRCYDRTMMGSRTDRVLKGQLEQCQRAAQAVLCGK